MSSQAWELGGRGPGAVSGPRGVQPAASRRLRSARGSGMPGEVLRPLSESVATLRCFPDSMVRAASGRGHKALADVPQEKPGVGDNDSKAALVPLHQALDGWREGMGALVPSVLPREGRGEDEATA